MRNPFCDDKSTRAQTAADAALNAELAMLREDLAPAWLAEPNVVAVGGSWLCAPSDIKSGNWAGITAMCERTVRSAKAA